MERSQKELESITADADEFLRLARIEHGMEDAPYLSNHQFKKRKAHEVLTRSGVVEVDRGEQFDRAPSSSGAKHRRLQSDEWDEK